MVKVLVTGGTGFFGRHVVECLYRSGAPYLGIGRSKVHGDSGAFDRSRFAVCDLRIAEAARVLIADYAPSHIIHLAGTYGRAVPDEDLDNNVVMMQNVCDGAALASKAPKLVVVSSASVYGMPQNLPVSEDHPCAPVTAYGKSKLDQETVAVRAAQERGIPTIIARCFNTTGPGEPARLLVGRVAAELVRLEGGCGGEVTVGNLTNRRDFIDIRDAAEAIVMLALRAPVLPGPEIVNVCSGRSIKTGDIVALLLAKAQKSITLRRDHSLFSGMADVPDIYGSNQKMAELTGWTPRIPYDESISDTLSHCRCLSSTSAGGNQ